MTCDLSADRKETDFEGRLDVNLTDRSGRSYCSTMLKDAVLDQSVALVVDRGLGSWSIEAVAGGARCAKGLVLYHYRSKATLLRLTVGEIERVRWDRRFEAIAGGTPGLDAIDRLWEAMVEDVDTGRFGAWVSLLTAGFVGTGPSRGDDFRSAVAKALGLPHESLADPASIEAMLEGMEFLLSRAPTGREGLRTGYDRLWTSMLAP